jgi:hypothetical protein
MDGTNRGGAGNAIHSTMVQVSEAPSQVVPVDAVTATEVGPLVRRASGGPSLDAR